MSAPFLSADELADMQTLDESNMPDELRTQTATTATDSLGHTYASGYATSLTVACRWRELSGRLADVDRALAPDATHYVWCPVGTTIALNQQIEVWQSSARALTAKVLWVITGSNATSIKLLCQEIVS
jgi:hypothetical protein